MSESRKHVCLGMPHYGTLTPGAAAGFYLAHHAGGEVNRKRVEPGELSVNGQQQGSSLLAMNMNILWCWALNLARKGECDYFAMIHSDIEPELWWLDKLIDELNAGQFDVLGVVAPIKDQRGVTSTAIDNLDSDPWNVRCRLTMREIYRLPETFTKDDLGYPLLINTGLWVCRFREEWAKQVHFEINDRIAFDPKLDLYFAQNEPEDWFVSRLFNEIGLKVGCTRKVTLGHRGEAVFGNHRGWGTDEYDAQRLSASTIACPDGEWFPESVAGWLTKAEGLELAKLAADKVVLELGSYCGRSTICLAQNARSVAAVDTFDGRGTAVPGDTLELFKSNVCRHGVGDRVSVHQGTTEEIVPNLPPVYDLVFIDGSHDYESVARDIVLALNVLKPGGLLVFHDYNRPSDPDVRLAVGELLADGAELVSQCDSLAVVRPTETLVPIGA